ncbi:MAG: eL32 family ribosomal protein [archaeon]
MSKRFKKQEYHRYARVGKTNVWRKPRGKHSKMREHRKGNPPVVDAGFGTCAEGRFIHPSGLAEIFTASPKDLAGVDKKTEGIRISARLSIRKKLEITKEASKLGIKVFNPAKEPKKKNKEAPPKETAAKAKKAEAEK